MRSFNQILLITLILTACGPNDPGSPPAINSVPSNESEKVSKATHHVCSIVRDEKGDDPLTAYTPIDNSEEWLIVDSLLYVSQAISDAANALPDDSEEIFPLLFASGAASSPAFADAFSSLPTLFYLCTEELFTLNQCNFVSDIDPSDDKKILIETVHGSNLAYSTTVTRVTGETSKTMLTIEGKRGDMGNLTISSYTDGALKFTRTSQRESNGKESAYYSAPGVREFYYYEDANCSGSAQLEFTGEKGNTIADMNWSFNGTTTSGNIYYFDPDKMEDPVDFSW